MMSRSIHIILICAFVLMLGACSTTRRIPSDEVLYTGLKGLDVVAPDSMKFPSELKRVLSDAVDVPATPKFAYVLPMGLWVYNNMEVNDSSSAIKKYIYNKFVEDPVLVSDVRPALRTKMLEQILENNGYFHGSATYDIVPSKKNPKKASIQYNVYAGRPFAIDSIEFIPDTTEIIHAIDSIARLQPYLRNGVTFCLDSLSEVRTNIAERLRNRGYYYFRPEYIEYLADTVAVPGKVMLRMVLAQNAQAFGLRKYETGKVTFHVYRHEGGGVPDTMQVGNVTLIQMQPSRLRHSVITDNVTFRPGRPFSVRNVNNTQSYLSRLGIFNGINIDAFPDTSATKPTINVDISATFDMPLEAQIEVNASSKSNSYIGPGLIVGITNHNIFGGGEQLSLKFTGTYEWQTGKGSQSLFNSYEFGLTGSLSFPRLLAPKFIPRRRRQINWTRINLGAEVLNRPHFFKLAQFNTSIQYDWNSSRYASNSLTLFKLSYNKLIHTTETFDSIMVANPAMALSFQSQFVPQMSYTFVYDRPYGRDNTLNLQTTVQQAGNLFWSMYELCGVHGEKKLFGTPFSQFVKGQAQIVWGHRLKGESWLVSRLLIGAAHAYGNSSQVPYAEQFYCGGANSVRAFTVRSLGPGSYRSPSRDYFDQTGTFKFEANVEYRFPIYGPLNGALFLDAGNIWLLRDDKLRPGGKLEADTFLKDLALGTGIGLRFDISMLVLRADLGIGIHAPYNTGRSGYYNMESFGKSLAFHLAIGYPF